MRGITAGATTRHSDILVFNDPIYYLYSLIALVVAVIILKKILEN